MLNSHSTPVRFYLIFNTKHDIEIATYRMILEREEDRVGLSKSTPKKRPRSEKSPNPTLPVGSSTESNTVRIIIYFETRVNVCYQLAGVHVVLGLGVIVRNNGG